MEGTETVAAGDEEDKPQQKKKKRLHLPRPHCECCRSFFVTNSTSVIGFESGVESTASESMVSMNDFVFFIKKMFLLCRFWTA